MKLNVLCYGVQEIERPIFESMNQDYQFNLSFTKELLNSNNAHRVKGFDAVILFVNCKADAKNLNLLKDNGVKYIVTRTAGYNHIDLKEAKKLDYTIGYVPVYSPSAIATLAMTLGLSLLRKTSYMNYKSANSNFNIDDHMFATEVKNCTIGIIGTGKIGLETAKLWKAFGAKVIAYDPYENSDAKLFLTYDTFDEIIAKSDLISLHTPYVAGKNDNLINNEVIMKMKPNSIIINTARGELVDIKAVISAIKQDHLWGYAADVLPNEELLINRNLKNKNLKDFPEISELVNLYPRILISPHVAYFTDEAVKNMAVISFENLKQLYTTNTCNNAIKVLD